MHRIRPHFAVVVTLLAGLVAAIVPSSVVRAQPLVERIPADAIIYVGWRGADDPGTAYGESHLKAILDQSNFSAVINDMLPRLAAKIGQKDRNAAEGMRMLSTIAVPMWHKPSAIFFSGVNFAHGAQPVPKFGILCQAGNDAAAIHDQIRALLAKNPPPPEVPLKSFVSNDVVALTFGYEDDETPLPGQAGAKVPAAITTDKSFGDALQQVQKDAVTIAYVNVEKFLALLDEAVQMSGDPHVLDMWSKTRDASGITGLRRIISTCGFDGKDWMSQAFIDAPGPRSGLLTMLDVKPLPQDLLRTIPSSATSVVAGSFDFAKFIETIRTAAGQVDPQAQQHVDQGLGAISMAIGKNFQNDVLAPLGEHWAVYSSPVVGGRGYAGMVLVNKPRDAAKAQQGLMSLAIAIVNSANSAAHDPNVAFRVNTTKVGDLSINYLGTPIVSPAWAFKDGTLYAGLYPQTVAAAARANAGGKSILDNEDFRAMQKRLGATDQLSGVSYSDLRQTVGDGYQIALALSRLAFGAADMIGVKSPELVLPPLDVILPHVTPAGGMAYVDDMGYHMKSVSPFPGAEILSGSLSPGALAMIGSVALPAMAKSKAAAQQQSSLSNLRQIGLACIMYANQHDGELPPDMGTLVTDNIVSRADIFVSPRGGKAPPPQNQGAEKQAEWVNAHSDFEFVAAGKAINKLKNSSQTILAYEKTPPANPNQIAAVFADGHAAMMTADQLKAALDRGWQTK